MLLKKTSILEQLKFFFSAYKSSSSTGLTFHNTYGETVLVVKE